MKIDELIAEINGEEIQQKEIMADLERWIEELEPRTAPSEDGGETVLPL